MSCPLCHAALPPEPRYPRRLCPLCAAQATDATGRPVRFANEELTGGITGRYTDTDTPYTEATCWVRGTRCTATEAHLGGIVIMPVMPA